VKAYFRKYGDDIIIKTGRKEKDYLPELVKEVDNFLETDARILENTDTYEGRQVMKQAEPSGADAMLIQLSQQTKTMDIPHVKENPLA